MSGLTSRRSARALLLAVVLVVMIGFAAFGVWLGYSWGWASYPPDPEAGLTGEIKPPPDLFQIIYGLVGAVLGLVAGLLVGLLTTAPVAAILSRDGD